MTPKGWPRKTQKVTRTKGVSARSARWLEMAAFFLVSFRIFCGNTNEVENTGQEMLKWGDINQLCDAAGGLDQAAVLARTSSACGDQRSIRIRAHHQFSFRRRGLDPNRHWHRVGWDRRSFSLRKFSQPL